MNQVFVDTSVFLLAQGGPHPRRQTCREFLDRCRTSGVSIHVSAEMLQEFIFHRLRARPRPQALAEATVLRHSLVLHPFDDQVLDEMLALLEASGLRGRDAVHAATARVARIEVLVTADSDFAGVPGLRAIGPEDWDGLQASVRRR